MRLGATVRRGAVLELRAQGLTFRAIGGLLGVSVWTAHTDYQTAMRECPPSPEEIALERYILNARIDIAIAGIFPFVRCGSLPHSDRLIALRELLARINGLDAPAETRVSVSVDSRRTAA